MRRLVPPAMEREDRERLLLVPLLELGPIIEQTKTPDELSQWFRDSYTWIERLSARHHTYDCFDHSLADGIYSCDNSIVCPLRAAGHYLMEPVIECDFDALEYEMDTWSAYQIARAKARAFIDACDDMPAYHATYLELFTERFAERFASQYLAAVGAGE